MGAAREIFEMATLPDLLSGKVQGRSHRQQKTWFPNVGAIGEQFTAVAAAVYRRAREIGLGRELPTDWFLENVRA